jgi:glycosyltransferase involved in cell wall biosynthesis
VTDLRINVFAEDYGWLFEDLKRHFVAAGRPGLRVFASCQPESCADGWVALRTAESHSSPDPARTVACIHDLFDDPGLYRPNGARRGARSSGGLWLCHPDIRSLLARDAVALGGRPVIERPIGALGLFEPRRSLSPRFTIGWIGRNDPIKRLPMFVAAIACAAAKQAPFDVMLVGEDLDPVAAEIRALDLAVEHHDRRIVPIEACPQLYQRMDALVITSASEGQPLVLFEALACGVPVISAPVGWAPHLAAAGPDFVRLAEGPKSIAAALAEVRSSRQSLFTQRHAIAELMRPWRLEGWLDDILDLAVRLVTGAAASRPAEALP